MGETLLFFQKILDHVRNEYGEIVKVSEIPNGKDEIDDVWNESDNKKVPDKKRGECQNSFLTDDDHILSISRNIYI